MCEYDRWKKNGLKHLDIQLEALREKFNGTQGLTKLEKKINELEKKINEKKINEQGASEALMSNEKIELERLILLLFMTLLNQ
jgi:hypothetical protein